ncbi:MAG: type II toxin-antitoxin system RelE/ParE family toxin [Betaproteobacteria bacterium]|nr:type II toxin-antitoxin system RelE/ParE family toxin [Betaproteobacteria bacterium]
MTRLDRVETGNFGDHKQIADNLYELRFFLGGGLRIYFTIRQNAIVLLLAGGDKDTQKRDVALAKQMLKQLLENQGTSE